MSDNIPLGPAVRLRGNAPASSRASDQQFRTLNQKAHPAVPGCTAVPGPTAAPANTRSPSPEEAAMRKAKDGAYETVWANSMLTVADEVAANLSAEGRRGARMQISSLREAGNHLLGKQSSPRPTGPASAPA